MVSPAPSSSRTKFTEARFLNMSPNPHPQVIRRVCLSRSMTEFILTVYSVRPSASNSLQPHGL